MIYCACITWCYGLWVTSCEIFIIIIIIIISYLEKFSAAILILCSCFFILSVCVCAVFLNLCDFDRTLSCLEYGSQSGLIIIY